MTTQPTTGSLYSFPVTKEQLGLLIDGVASLVDGEHREAAPLLERLQFVYAAALMREAKDA
jgi:hypothetical protein